MFRILPFLLVAFAACFYSNASQAQTPCTSQITTHWYYASTCYPSQNEAVAAMQSDPSNPANSTLTIMAESTNMSNGATQYKYVAPSPISIANGITVYWGGRGPVFPTQAQALSYIINAIDPPTQCGATTGVPYGAPMYSSDLGSPSYGPGYFQYYTANGWGYDIYSNPQCGELPGSGANANWIIDWWQSSSCPTYYTLSGSQCVNTSTAYITSTSLTCTSPSTLTGDPCDAASGEFTQTENDFSAAGLTLTRVYHSATLEQFHGFGVGWTHNYAAQLVINGGVPVGLLRPDGHHDPLANLSSASYVTLSGDGIHVLAPNTSGNPSANYWAVLPDGSKEVYNTSGVLIQLVSPGGAVTTLNYSGGVLSSVVGPFGHQLIFIFSNGNITKVQDPGVASFLLPKVTVGFPGNYRASCQFPLLKQDVATPDF